jgi:hypothetical protein
VTGNYLSRWLNQLTELFWTVLAFGVAGGIAFTKSVDNRLLSRHHKCDNFTVFFQRMMIIISHKVTPIKYIFPAVSFLFGGTTKEQSVSIYRCGSQNKIQCINK